MESFIECWHIEATYKTDSERRDYVKDRIRLLEHSFQYKEMEYRLLTEFFQHGNP